MNTDEKQGLMARDGKDNRVIHTKLKFSRSESNGAMIGFVSFNTTNNRPMGVREDCTNPKKICVVDRLLAFETIPNVLYECTLMKMQRKDGYVVTEMTPVKFKATISTTYVRNYAYIIDVSFGNKKMKFDPYRGKKKEVSDINAFEDALRRRVDIKDLDDVIAEFDDSARRLLELMESDRITYGYRRKGNDKGKTNGRNSR